MSMFKHCLLILLKCLQYNEDVTEVQASQEMKKLPVVMVLRSLYKKVVARPDSLFCKLLERVRNICAMCCFFHLYLAFQSYMICYV